ncbi:unnamed protein product [Linum trigynum]|uniref:Uncharacterized protein n=1 Tax=Linum trigynum TaxID=586398 RepID=A0AAV2F9I6_9ROSI
MPYPLPLFLRPPPLPLSLPFLISLVGPKFIAHQQLRLSLQKGFRILATRRRRKGSHLLAFSGDWRYGFSNELQRPSSKEKGVTSPPESPPTTTQMVFDDPDAISLASKFRR